MDGAFGGNGDPRESADEALANLAGTPARVLTLHVQDVVLHLKRKLVGMAVGPSAPVRQALHPTFLVAIEDLVARLAGDPNSLQSSAIASPASRRATNCNLSSITEHSFHGIHFLPKKGESITYVSGTFC